MRLKIYTNKIVFMKTVQKEIWNLMKREKMIELSYNLQSSNKYLQKLTYAYPSILKRQFLQFLYN